MLKTFVKRAAYGPMALYPKENLRRKIRTYMMIEKRGAPEKKRVFQFKFQICFLFISCEIVQLPCEGKEDRACLKTRFRSLYQIVHHRFGGLLVHEFSWYRWISLV